MCRIDLIVSGENSSVRISFPLVACIANLHAAYVEAREKEHDARK
jgi:hypothetical protein